MVVFGCFATTGSGELVVINSNLLGFCSRTQNTPASVFNGSEGHKEIKYQFLCALVKLQT